MIYKPCKFCGDAVSSYGDLWLDQTGGDVCSGNDNLDNEYQFHDVHKPNIAEMKAVYAYIQAHPDEWDQSNWASRLLIGGSGCQTAFCFAGHVAVRAGYEPHFSDHPWTATVTNGNEEIADVAQQILDIDDYTAEALFVCTNNLETLGKIIDEIEKNGFYYLPKVYEGVQPTEPF